MKKGIIFNCCMAASIALVVNLAPTAAHATCNYSYPGTSSYTTSKSEACRAFGGYEYYGSTPLGGYRYTCLNLCSSSDQKDKSECCCERYGGTWSGGRCLEMSASANYPSTGTGDPFTDYPSSGSGYFTPEPATTTTATPMTTTETESTTTATPLTTTETESTTTATPMTTTETESTTTATPATTESTTTATPETTTETESTTTATPMTTTEPYTDTFTTDRGGDITTTPAETTTTLTPETTTEPYTETTTPMTTTPETTSPATTSPETTTPPETTSTCEEILPGT